MTNETEKLDFHAGEFLTIHALNGEELSDGLKIGIVLKLRQACEAIDKINEQLKDISKCLNILDGTDKVLSERISLRKP